MIAFGCADARICTKTIKSTGKEEEPVTSGQSTIAPVETPRPIYDYDLIDKTLIMEPDAPADPKYDCFGLLDEANCVKGQYKVRYRKVRVRTKEEGGYFEFIKYLYCCESENW